MPSNNNTTGYDANDGLVSSLAQQINSALSYDNIDAELNDNPKLQSLYKSVVNMVQGYLDGDKQRIIGEVRPQALQSIQKLKGPARVKALTEECAKCILASVPQKDLLKLLSRARANQQNTVRQIGLAEANKDKFARQFAKNIKDYKGDNDPYNAMANQTNAQQQLKILIKDAGGKNGTFSFNDQVAKNAIPKLEKELDNVLSKKRLSSKDLATIAGKLDIPIKQGQSFDDLKKKIKNIVMIYALLVMGKEQGISASRFTPMMITQIEEILLNTSYGYLTGKAGVNASYIRDKRKAAEKAKRETDAQSKNIEGRSSADSKLKIKRKKAKYDAEGNKLKGKDKYDENGNRRTEQVVKSKFSLLPGKRKKNQKNVEIYEQVRRELMKQFKITERKDGTYDISKKDLKESFYKYAESMGITEPESMSVEEVLSQLANMASGEVLDIRESYAAALKEKDPAKRKQMLNTLKTREENSMLTAMKSQQEKYTQDFSDKIPVVSYNNAGEITSETISMAVPVWIVGQGGPGVTYDGDKEAARMRRDDDNADTSTLYDILRKNEDEKALQKAAKKGKTRHTDAANLSDSDVLHYKKSKKSAKEKKEEERRRSLVATKDSNLSSIIPQQQSVALTNDNTNLDVAVKDNRTVDGSIGFKNKFEFKPVKKAKKEKLNLNPDKDLFKNIKKEKQYKLSSYKKKLNGISLKLWSKFAPATTDVIPVFDINKSHELSEQIGEKLYKMHDDIAAINAVVGQLPTMWSTLQEGGLTFNAAAAGGVTAMVGGIAGKATQVVGQSITQGSTQMATGGSMNGRTNSSTIVTGDPRRTTPNKPNPELVSVNWRSKKIDVTPIPQFATGGSTSGNNSSNVSGISRMTSYERNKPMSVGISTGLITYSKTLSDVTDSGDKTAIKVYSINSGINEKIKVGDSELSLFDAVYGIYGTISTLAETVSSQSQIQSQIASGITALNTTAKSIAENMNNSGASQFEFTDSFDNMLRGE